MSVSATVDDEWRKAHRSMIGHVFDFASVKSPERERERSELGETLAAGLTVGVEHVP